MKMNATEITARREQIKTTRANIKTVTRIYRETSDQTPAETVAEIVAALGYDAAREAVAEIVNTVGEWDGRIWPSSREWAATIETAATRDELEAKSIYQPAEIHPAHINQLAQAMSKYAPPAPQEQEAPAQDTAEIMQKAGAVELSQRVALYVPGTQGPYTVKHETAPAPAIIAKLTNEQLLKAWETTEFLSTSPETAITRGWIMDELEKRNPSAFNAWLDSESPEDSTLRRYFTEN